MIPDFFTHFLARNIFDAILGRRERSGSIFGRFGFILTRVFFVITGAVFAGFKAALFFEWFLGDDEAQAQSGGAQKKDDEGGKVIHGCYYKD